MEGFSILRYLLVLLLTLPGVISSSFYYEDSHFRYEMPGVDLKGEKFGCPDEVECDKDAPYREFDGKCNNLKNSLWGSAGIPYRRFIPAQRHDDPSNRRKLPTARQIVSALNSLPVQLNSKITVLAMIWGQFVSHDVNLTPRFSGLHCCWDCCDFPIEGSECLAVDVRNDPFYQRFGVECFENFRSVPPGSACEIEGREQVNGITAYIDASLVYGVSKEAADELRTMSNGQMKVRNVSENYPGGYCPAESSCPFSLLPTVIINGEENVLAGHPSAVQQPLLTALHTLGVRVHNDFASRLAELHKDDVEYGDEKIYQEARRLNIALIQHITYNEYLPSILPSWALAKYGLPSLSPGEGYLNGYKRYIDASARNAFTTAAFRFGHSLVPDTINLQNGNNFELSHSFNNNTFTFNPGTYPSDILNGIDTQMSQEVDQNLVSSLSNRLFANPPNYDHGLDLYSRNIMRGRDHGLPSYTQYRAYCNLPSITNFRDLRDVLREGVAETFNLLYRSVDDIDLYPALISEIPDTDGIVGPTLACLLGEQFMNFKYGDRFFFENRKQHPHRFTRAQLDSIRRTTLAALLCYYIDTKVVPVFVMKVLGPGNYMENCEEILAGTVLARFDKLF
ncbi:UNVERIFIED_CONTAM: hypothetical protein RMT77_016371 [Armadillidium vulgare]